MNVNDGVICVLCNDKQKNPYCIPVEVSVQILVNSTKSHKPNTVELQLSVTPERDQFFFIYRLN